MPARIYDNIETAVETILVGKDRGYRRFLQMCAHYLVEPVVCKPALGGADQGLRQA